MLLFLPLLLLLRCVLLERCPRWWRMVRWFLHASLPILLLLAVQLQHLLPRERILKLRVRGTETLGLLRMGLVVVVVLLLLLLLPLRLLLFRLRLSPSLFLQQFELVQVFLGLAQRRRGATMPTAAAAASIASLGL